MMFSACAHGTSFKRSVTVPVTLSDTTRFKPVKSAITCSKERMSMF